MLVRFEFKDRHIQELYEKYEKAKDELRRALGGEFLDIVQTDEDDQREESGE